MERNWLGEEGRKQFPANSMSMESAKKQNLDKILTTFYLGNAETTPVIRRTR